MFLNFFLSSGLISKQWITNSATSPVRLSGMAGGDVALAIWQDTLEPLHTSSDKTYSDSIEIWIS